MNQSNQGASAAPSLRYAWYVVIVLMVCYTISFVDRQILGFLVGPIKQDLGISDTRIGLLQGLAFAFFYTLMGLPLGRLADRLSRRNIIAVGLVFWSFMTAACSMAMSFGTLFLARIGVGVGEATLGPSAFSLISDYFPKEKLSTALSVYAMGIFIGSGLASLVGGMVVGAVSQTPSMTVPLLGQMASWRVTFLVVGLPGLLVALLLFTVREPLRRGLKQMTDGQLRGMTVAEVTREIKLRWQSVAGISVAMACQAMPNYAISAWVPSFFARVHGWSPGQTGLYLGSITLVFGCIGMYVGGRLCDSWLAQGRHEAPLRTAIIGIIGTGVSLILAMFAQDPMVTVALLVPTFVFLGIPIGGAYASLQWIFPNQVRGVVTALLLFVLNMIALGLGPLLPGVFTDYLFEDEKMVGYSIALTTALSAIVGATLMRLTYAPYRRHYAMMHGAAPQR